MQAPPQWVDGSAYEVYTKSMVRNRENADHDPTVLYRRIFARSRAVSVEFLGVWVGATLRAAAHAPHTRATLMAGHGVEPGHLRGSS